jgi:hypothetical protein
MLLAVAGQSPSQIAERSKQLAEDWSAFPPAEQAAFAFARKLSAAAARERSISCGGRAAATS